MFRFFGRRKSKDTLKERLNLVLSYDRANISPGRMEELKAELLEVIAKYFPADTKDYDVKMEQQGDRMVMVADIPVTPGRD